MRHLEYRKIRKIFIRSTNWIGDAVMTTPALGAIRETFPQAELVMAANPIIAELFSPHPFIDRVLVFDKKNSHQGVVGFLKFCHEVRKERFDMAILLQNAIEAGIIAFFAQIPVRAGYRTDGRRLLLTHSVPVGEHERRIHHTDYYAHMLAELGIRGQSRKLVLGCTSSETAWARDLLPEGKNWIAVNPGAAFGSAKRWLPERFAAVADAIVREYDANILLTGSSGEVGIGKEIEEILQARPLNLIGQTSVRQLMAVLSLCRLVITNDSGPMHVAAALGIPLVALFGSTDHTTTSPLTPNFRIVRKDIACAPCLKRTCPKDHACMEAITVEDVLNAVRELYIP
jgi:heptosyltransferase-2